MLIHLKQVELGLGMLGDGSGKKVTADRLVVQDLRLLRGLLDHLVGGHQRLKCWSIAAMDHVVGIVEGCLRFVDPALILVMSISPLHIFSSHSKSVGSAEA
jgi:hypothetical protein